MNATVTNREGDAASRKPPNEHVFYFCGHPISESPYGHDSQSEDLVRIYRIVKSSSFSEESSKKKKQKSGNAHHDHGSGGDGQPPSRETRKKAEKNVAENVGRDRSDSESWMSIFLRDAVNLFSKFLTSAVDQFLKVVLKNEGAANSATDGKSKQFSENTQSDANLQNPKEKRVTQSTFQAIDSSKAILIEDLIIKPPEVLPLGNLKVLQSADKINSSLVEMRSTGESCLAR